MRASLTAAALALALPGCGSARSSDLQPVIVASVTAERAGDELVAPVPARNALDAPGAFAIVEEESGWLILDDEVKEEALAGSPFDASLHSPGARSAASGTHVLEAKVKLAELGPEMRMEGRSFVLYRGAERKCVIRAGVVRAVGYTSDDFTTDEDTGPGSPPPPSEEEQARTMWSSSNTFIAAKIDLAPACKGATWARLEELPEPRFATVRAPVGPIAEKATTAFQSRPRWAEAQKSWLEANGGAAQAKSGTWEDLGSVTVSELAAPFAGGSFVVRQSVWEEGCGANAGLTMVWSDVDGSLSQVFEADDRFSLEVAMDLDGDGTLEMFGTEGDGPSLRPFWGTERDDTRQGPWLSHAYAFHGCRC